MAQIQATENGAILPHNVRVVDCDGHLAESIPELAEFMDPSIRRHALSGGRNRQGVFPTLDGMHYPDLIAGEAARFNARRDNWTQASEHRKGSGEDCAAFVEKAGITDSVLFPSEGLSVGNLQMLEYTKRLCQAYNDYVVDRYMKIDKRLHPAALIPMQDPKEAILELRRAVRELGLTGAMLPSRGLPLDLSHEYYWPVYKEAASLGCALAIHGGANVNLGMDSSHPLTAKTLHHSIPLMIALTGFMFSGVFDRYPDLRMGFLEGGAGWAAFLVDRLHRQENVTIGGVTSRSFTEYMASGQILIGCEGNDLSLPFLAKHVGVDAFAYASDYPHEVDLPAARKMIKETLEQPELTLGQKAAILGDNARRFFRLEKPEQINRGVSSSQDSVVI